MLLRCRVTSCSGEAARAVCFRARCSAWERMRFPKGKVSSSSSPLLTASDLSCRPWRCRGLIWASGQVEACPRRRRASCVQTQRKEQKQFPGKYFPAAFPGSERSGKKRPRFKLLAGERTPAGDRLSLGLPHPAKLSPPPQPHTGDGTKGAEPPRGAAQHPGLCSAQGSPPTPAASPSSGRAEPTLWKARGRNLRPRRGAAAGSVVDSALCLLPPPSSSSLRAVCFGTAQPPPCQRSPAPPAQQSGGKPEAEAGNREQGGKWRSRRAARADGTRRSRRGGQEGHGSLGNLGGLGEAGKGRESRKQGAWPGWGDAEVGAQCRPRLGLCESSAPDWGVWRDAVPRSLEPAEDAGSAARQQQIPPGAVPRGAPLPAGAWLEHQQEKPGRKWLFQPCPTQYLRFTPADPGHRALQAGGLCQHTWFSIPAASIHRGVRWWKCRARSQGRTQVCAPGTVLRAPSIPALPHWVEGGCGSTAVLHLHGNGTAAF